MTWKIIIHPDAEKDFAKIDRHWRHKIYDYLTNRIAILEDPTAPAKPLRANLAGLWRYRVGDYRIICQIRNNEIEILVLAIGHRSTVYK